MALFAPQPDETLLTKKGGKYRVKQLLGNGGYGSVYQVERADGAVFAAKIESIDIRREALRMDALVLKLAQKTGSLQHMCVFEDSGRVDGRFRFLVMNMLGKNLQDLRIDNDNCRFTLGTGLKVAEQTLHAIQELHELGFLHRDIKPGNYAIGLENVQQIYIFDFGMSRQFVRSDGKIVAPRQSAPFRGTLKYSSRNCLRGVEQARKDDLESWFYMVVESMSGKLPWKKKKQKDNFYISVPHVERKKERERNLKLKDKARNDQSSCEKFLKHLPGVDFLLLMNYIDELEYAAVPDYDYCYFIIRHAALTKSVDWLEPLDWDEKREKYVGVKKPFLGEELLTKKVEENETAVEDLIKPRVRASEVTSGSPESSTREKKESDSPPETIPAAEKVDSSEVKKTKKILSRYLQPEAGEEAVSKEVSSRNIMQLMHLLLKSRQHEHEQEEEKEKEEKEKCKTEEKEEQKTQSE